MTLFLIAGCQPRTSRGAATLVAKRADLHPGCGWIHQPDYAARGAVRCSARRGATRRLTLSPGIVMGPHTRRALRGSLSARRRPATGRLASCAQGGPRRWRRSSSGG